MYTQYDNIVAFADVRVLRPHYYQKYSWEKFELPHFLSCYAARKIQAEGYTYTTIVLMVEFHNMAREYEVALTISFFI